MKKIKLIYNPVAGDQTFKNHLDTFIAKFQVQGYKVDIYRSMKQGDLLKGLDDIDREEFEDLFIAGGDGSVNKILNGIMNRNLKLPLGIIPAGTANDFATYLNMPLNFNKCFDVLLKNNLQNIDIGQVNNEYFINVCVGGVLSRISHSTDTEAKNRLGKIAYYINGIKEIPKIKPMNLKISSPEHEIEDKFYMFIILNSKGAGGFTNLAKKATINDGKLDFIGLRARNILKLSPSIIKFFQGGKFNNDDIVYFQDTSFTIKAVDDFTNNYFCDIDGEKGPKFPLHVSVLPEQLTVFRN